MILILFLEQATISLIPPFFREKSEPLFLEELIVTQTTLPYKKGRVQLWTGTMDGWTNQQKNTETYRQTNRQIDTQQHTGRKTS